MMRTTIVALAAVAALAAPGRAAQDEFRWSGQVAAGDAVEIKGVNGAIVATGAPGGDVEVVAVKKGRRSDPAAVKVEVVEHPGGVTICAVYPNEGAPNECVPGKGGRMKVKDNDVSVEFRVKVPAGVRFVGRTVNGGIDVAMPEGLSADVKASTVNGDIRTEFPLTVTGTISKRRVEGTIGSGGRLLEMETVNGGIELTKAGAGGKS